MTSVSPALAAELLQCAHLIAADQSQLEVYGLTEEEAATFSIDPGAWPFMAAVYCLFTVVVDIELPESWGFSVDLIEAERAAWPGLPHRSTQLEDFQSYSARWLTSVEAVQTSAKVFFWFHRNGLLVEASPEPNAVEPSLPVAGPVTIH